MGQHWFRQWHVSCSTTSHHIKQCWLFLIWWPWGPITSAKWKVKCYDIMMTSQMETFSALLAFLRGIHRPPVSSPHKGQWRRALLFSIICAWRNGWVNNRDAGDLRGHRAHYEVTVMIHTRNYLTIPCEKFRIFCSGFNSNQFKDWGKNYFLMTVHATPN